MPQPEMIEDFSLKQYFSPFTTIKAIHFLIVIGIIVYGNSLLNGFVGDDFGQIVDNTFIHSIKNVLIFFHGSTFYNGNAQILVGNYYRPLFITFFSFVYTVFGPNPFFFHLAQIILHISNSILLFIFFKKFFKLTLAFFLSAIFLVHPINSEVVFYISDTQELLFFLFGMSALLLFDSVKKEKYIIIVVIFLLASLLSKETGILFVFILCIFAFIFNRVYLRELIFFSTFSLFLYFILRISAVGFFDTPKNSSIATYSLSVRMINIPSMFWYYIKTFIFPLNLASSYQWVYTNINFNHFYKPLFYDCIFFFVCSFLMFNVIKKSQKEKLKITSFFIIWFFVGMLIHMQFIPLDATVAEGWFYFPMVGLLGILGIIFEKIYFTYRKSFLLVILVLICLFSCRTFIRSFDWKEEFTIASHDIKISPDAWGLENELSYAYFEKGMYQDAKNHAEKSIHLHPFAINYMNLGASEFAMKQYKLAQDAYLKSLYFDQFDQTYESLGLLTLSYGDQKKNITFLKNNALNRYPYDGKLWFYLAVLEYNYGSKENAKEEIKNAYVYDPELQVEGAYNAIMNNQPVKIEENKK